MVSDIKFQPGLIPFESYSSFAPSGEPLVFRWFSPHGLVLPTGGVSSFNVTGININANSFNFPDAVISTSTTSRDLSRPSTSRPALPAKSTASVKL